MMMMQTYCVHVLKSRSGSSAASCFIGPASTPVQFCLLHNACIGSELTGDGTRSHLKPQQQKNVWIFPEACSIQPGCNEEHIPPVVHLLYELMWPEAERQTVSTWGKEVKEDQRFLRENRVHNGELYLKHKELSTNALSLFYIYEDNRTLGYYFVIIFARN